jgi:hypothetical protein
MGPNETQSYLHQLLLQYFEFAKSTYSQYRSAWSALRSRQLSLSEKQRSIVLSRRSQAATDPNSPLLASLTTAAAILTYANDPKQWRRDFVCWRIATSLMTEIVDIPTAQCGISFGFSAGNVSPVLVSLRILQQNSRPMFRPPFPDYQKWIENMPLDATVFVPAVTSETKFLSLNASSAAVATNGRYVYISESTGRISVFLRGRKLQEVVVSKKGIVFAALDSVLYVADGDSNYFFNSYPLEKIREDSKFTPTFRICSDGLRLYVYRKPKRVMICTLNRSSCA